MSDRTAPPEHFSGQRTKNDLVCGVQPVKEALLSDAHVEKLLIRRDAGGPGISQIKQLARDREVPWQPVPAEKLDKLSVWERLLRPVRTWRGRLFAQWRGRCAWRWLSCAEC